MSRAMKLHRCLGISYNGLANEAQANASDDGTRIAIKSSLGFIELDDAYLGGERTGCKRGSRRSGPRLLLWLRLKPPLIAVRLGLSCRWLKGFGSSEIKSWSQQHLAEGSTVISDGLACFNAVTESGCTHDKIVCGGGRSVGRGA